MRGGIKPIGIYRRAAALPVGEEPPLVYLKFAVWTLKGDAPDPYYRGHRGVAVRAMAFRALSSPRIEELVLCRNQDGWR